MWPLLWIDPPYDRLRDAAPGDLAAAAPGGILVVDVPAPDDIEPARLFQFVADLRRRTDASIALRLPRAGGSASVRIALHAYPSGVRATLVRDEPLEPALRHFLAHPPDVAGDLLAWLRLRLRRPVSAGVADLLAEVMREAPAHDTLECLLAHLAIRPRTLRHRLDHEGLPGPGKWFQLARLLDAQLRLLRDPELDVARVALELGYADRLSFTNRVCRLFGATAERARRLFGLEWRFAAWWRRVSAAPESPSARICRPGF